MIRNKKLIDRVVDKIILKGNVTDIVIKDVQVGDSDIIIYYKLNNKKGERDILKLSKIVEINSINSCRFEEVN